MKKYDYILVGAGLYNGVFAYLAGQKGKQCLVVEKRGHMGGNIYCEMIEGIAVHRYGAHIFHTSNERVWKFVTSLVAFNHFINSPIANYKGEIYNLPFNMNTFSRMWGISAPEEARRIIARQQEEITGTPRNLEEQAISLVGRDIYEKLIKGYTEKQWGRDCRELPAFIIKRLPVRFTYNNNYFNDVFQGIPEGGYNQLIERLYEGCEVELNTDYLDKKEEYQALADKIIYTGPIDAYYGYALGKLEYRSLKFESEILAEENHQGVAVVNFTERDIPYTRSIEHKHFDFGTQAKTVVTKEYPADWSEGMEPYYPINNEANQALYEQYAALAKKETGVVFGGRLGEYRYYDMDKVIESAFQMAEKELG